MANYEISFLSSNLEAKDTKCVVAHLPETQNASNGIMSVVSGNFPYGRQKYRASFYGELNCLPMTVIASAYTPEGFVIAADGRRRNEEGNAPVTDRAQKVFPGHHPQFSFAYAWTGATAFDLPNGERFSFLDETVTAIRSLVACHIPSIVGYATELSEELTTRLFECNGYAFPYFQKEDVARLLLVGYFNGKAIRVGIRFQYTNGRLVAEIFEVIEEPCDFNIFTGSAVAFRQMGPLEPPTSLSEAAYIIETYIDLCVNGANQLPDYKDFGGHIHIAQVTKDGFTWRIAPIGQV